MKQNIKRILAITGAACFFIVNTAVSSGETEELLLSNEGEPINIMLNDTCKCPPIKEAQDTIRKVILGDYYQVLPGGHINGISTLPKKFIEKRRRIVKEPWIELRFDECNPKDGEAGSKEEACEKKGCYYSFRVQLEIIYEYNVTQNVTVIDTIYPFITSSSNHFGLPCEQSPISTN